MMSDGQRQWKKSNLSTSHFIDWHPRPKRMTSSSQHPRQCPCKLLPQSLSSFTAAEYGDLHSLMKRPDVARKVGPGGMMPLHYTAQNGHAAATALLLGFGADVDGHPKDRELDSGATPLHRASFSGAVATMQVLIQWGSDTVTSSPSDHRCDLLAKDTSFGDQMTPLHKAAAGGRPLAVQLLLEAMRGRSSELLRQGLVAKDSFGRTPLEVAISIDPMDETNSVKRWDRVAGGIPDWDQCIAILECAEKEIGFDLEEHQAPKLPTLPKHLLDTSSCLDCGAEDGKCLTSSWEAAFRGVLLSSANQAISADRETNLNYISRQRQETETVTINEKKVDNTNKTMECSVQASASSNEEINMNDAYRSNAENKVQMGQTCGECGSKTLALFRGKGGVLVCKNCRGSSRRMNVIKVVKMQT